MGRGLAAALALALALPFALAGTTFLVVPTTEGAWRGVADPPGLSRLLAAFGGGALAAWGMARTSVPSSTWRPFLVGWLAALPWVPVLTGRGVALLAFAWPLMRILLFAAAGVAALRLLQRRPTSWPPSWVWPVGVFLFYALLWRDWPGPAGPTGDEPHYLTLAESLRTDGDLDLRDEMEGRAYSRFYAGTLAPHTSPASPPGRDYSIHTPGLPALLLPAYALGGYTGARLFMAVIAAVTGWVLYRLARETVGGHGAALAAMAALVLTPPFAFYAMSIYPEMPVALAAALLLTGARPGAAPGWVAAAVVAAAAVPWLHPKYLPMAVIGVALGWRRRAPVRGAVSVAVLAASVAGLLAFMHAHYGRASLAAAYGPGVRDDVTLARALWGAPALLLDRQFGLFAIAPLWLLAIPGAIFLARRSRPDAWRACLVAGAAFGVNACYSMWWGGTCPPARFLVPSLPALAVAVALAGRRWPGATAALTGAGFGVLCLAQDAPRALHNRADGESALLRVIARGVDLDRLFPSFVAGDPRALAPRWPGLDPQGATLALLDAYDDRALIAVSGPVRPETLRLPLTAPEAPWLFDADDARVPAVRRTRPVDLAAGRYRVEAAGRILDALPTAHVVRLDLLADDDRLGRTYLEDGQPPPSFEIDLSQGARRVQIEATAIQGRGEISAATVLPREILPRAARGR